ncbi:MAG TPA: hypothetical protein VK013_15050 [Myxococcaceae bacterium]|nr:hypothetical protein [Myxococcaceae bacterium]
MRRSSLCPLLALLVLLLTPVARAEVIYLQLELRRDGKVVGQPQLVGETGKALKAVRRAPGAVQPDWSLQLMPRAEGDHYELQLGLEIGERRGHSDVSLDHGQRRQVRLEGNDELEVRVLLMRVDSPEFRALMDLPPEPREGPARSI